MGINDSALNGQSITGISHGLTSPNFRIFFIGLWLLAANGLFSSNRYIICHLDFPYPLSLFSWQLLVTFIITGVLHFRRLVRCGSTHFNDNNSVSWKSYKKFVLPAALCLGFSPVCATLAFKLAPTRLLIILLTLQPIGTAVLGKFNGVHLTNHKLSYVIAIVLCLICVFLSSLLTPTDAYPSTDVSQSAYMCSTYNGIKCSFERTTSLSNATTSGLGLGLSVVESDVSLAVNYGHNTHGHQMLDARDATVFVTILGSCLAILAMVSNSLSNIALDRIVHGKNSLMNPLTLMFFMSPIAFVVASIGAALIESPNIRVFSELPTLVLFTNVSLAVILLCSIPAIIAMGSALSFTIADQLCKWFMVFLACSSEREDIGMLQLGFFFIAVVLFAKDAERSAQTHLAVHEFPSNERDSSSANLQEVHSGGEGASLRSIGKGEPFHYLNVNMFVLMTALVLVILWTSTLTSRSSSLTFPVSTSLPELRSEVLPPAQDRKLATIIETRNLPHLGPLLLSFLSVLPSDWPILAWVSPENIEVLKSSPSILRQVQSQRLTLRLFPDQFDIHNQEYLSRFLTKPWFWENLDAEWILFFQSDSVLCSKSPQSIEDWIGFDWVGAPWKDDKNAHGGNGGLSMRKRSSLLNLTNNADIAREDWGDAEDVWFSNRLKELPGVHWPTEHQGRFSIENVWDEMQEWTLKPLGVHSGGEPPKDWRNERIMRQLMDWCPELKLFYDPVKWLT